MVSGLLKYKMVLRMMLVLALMLGMSPPIASAMPVDSYGAAAAVSARQMYIDHIQTLLETETARAKLSAMGIDRDALARGLPQLSDAQLRQLAGRSEAVASGGDAGIILVLLLIIIVLAMLYIADYQMKIEPRTRDATGK